MAWYTNVDMPLNKETKPKLAKIDFFYILNWIVSNRTIFDMENALTLNWIAWKRTLLTKIRFILNWIILLTTVFQNWVAWNRKVFENETVNFCKTELFEIEQLICIKTYFTLTNQRRLISHKKQTNKQTNWRKSVAFILYSNLWSTIKNQ